MRSTSRLRLSVILLYRKLEEHSSQVLRNRKKTMIQVQSSDKYKLLYIF